MNKVLLIMLIINDFFEKYAKYNCNTISHFISKIRDYPIAAKSIVLSVPANLNDAINHFNQFGSDFIAKLARNYFNNDRDEDEYLVNNYCTAFIKELAELKNAIINFSVEKFRSFFGNKVPSDVENRLLTYLILTPDYASLPKMLFDEMREHRLIEDVNNELKLIDNKKDKDDRGNA